MSGSTKRIEAQERRGVPPLWCAHAERLRALVRRSVTVSSMSGGALEREGGPRRFETLLQFKGFGGGVPLNTETAAMKPRVGSAS